jgi:predicted transcriptional regulator
MKFCAHNIIMERDKILEKLKKEAAGRGQVTRLAKRIGIPIVTLWRITESKFKGSIDTWDKIFKYYRK